MITPAANAYRESHGFITQGGRSHEPYPETTAFILRDGRGQERQLAERDRPQGDTMAKALFPFTRRQRLLKSGQFRRVFQTGSRVSDRFFTAIAASAPSAESGHPCCRLGLAISRKAAPRAVDRNRIKRVVRESFRLASPGWTSTNLDFVILAGKDAARASNADLHHSLRMHWRRLQADARGVQSSPSCAE